MYHPLYESHPRVSKYHLKSTFVMTVHLDVVPVRIVVNSYQVCTYGTHTDIHTERKLIIGFSLDCFISVDHGTHENSLKTASDQQVLPYLVVCSIVYKIEV